MTNESTPEEKEKGRAENVKNTLEYKLLQKIVGGNNVKANPFFYGQLGVSGGEQTYLEAMISEGADKERKRIYADRIKEKTALGLAEDPAYPTNYDVAKGFKIQLMQVQSIAKIGELEEHAKAVGAKLDFEVPEELKNYIKAELTQKAMTENGKIDESKLSEQEKDALGIYGVLTKAYERAISLNVSQSNYFADINKAGTQIADKYKKEEKATA